MKKVLFVVVAILVGIPALAMGGLWLAGMRSGAGHTGASIVINRPAAEIWPYLTEAAKLKQWTSGIEEITPISGGGVAVGAKSRVLARGRPEEAPISMDHEFTAVEANKRLGYTLKAELQGMGFTSKCESRLDEKAGGTTVTILSQSRYKGFFPKLFEPVISRSAQEKVADDLRALKQLVESAGPAGPIVVGAPPMMERPTAGGAAELGGSTGEMTPAAPPAIPPAAAPQAEPPSPDPVAPPVAEPAPAAAPASAPAPASPSADDRQLEGADARPSSDEGSESVAAPEVDDAGSSLQ